MTLSMLLLFSLCYCLDEIEFSTSTKRRYKFTDEKSMKSIRDAHDSYVYLYLPKHLSIEDLKSHGINVSMNDMILKNVYKMYLKSDQIQYLQSNGAKIIKVDPNDKLVGQQFANKKGEILVNGDFKEKTPHNDKLFHTLYTANDNTIVIQTDKVDETAEYLRNLNEVEYIQPYTKNIELNNLASGFIQNNNYQVYENENEILVHKRYLEEKGLNGEGQNIAILDSPIDYLHTFFYDDNTETFDFNKVMANNRKFVYYYNRFNGNEEELWNNDMSYANHGSHVAGIAAGCALNSNSKISAYNGVATGSKIFYAGSFNNNENEFLNDTKKFEEFRKLIKNTNTSVFTNSWASQAHVTIDLQKFDDYAKEEIESLLILFAAGNSGSNEKIYTVFSPSNAKNILSVGSNELLYSTSTPEYSLILSDDKIIHFNGSDLLKQKAPCYECYATITKLNDFKLKKDSPKILYFDDETLEDSNARTLASEQKDNYECIAALFHIKKSNAKIMKKINSFVTLLKIDSLLLNDDITDYIGKQVKFTINFTQTFQKTGGRAYFSSIGPSYNGVIKPEIIAPGFKIISAGSQGIKQPNHGDDNNKSLYFADLVYKNGTSMAAPNAAGAAAIISQYLSQKYYLNEEVKPNGLILKAMLIASASRNGYSNSNTPDCYTGFGLIDLSRVLTFGEFGLRFSKIDTFPNDKKHLKGKISVSKDKDQSLIFVLSHSDEVLSLESLLPIFCDLDLIVVTPSGKILTGNEKKSGNSEHLTPNEKIIIKSEDVEDGDYEIHILSNIPDDVNVTAKYVVVAVGPFQHNDVKKNPIYIEMKPTEECLTLNENGVCKNGKLECKEGYTGILCQNNIAFIEEEAKSYSLRIEPNDFTYLRIPSSGYPKNSIVFSKYDEKNEASIFYVSENQNLLLPQDALSYFYIDDGSEYSFSGSKGFYSMIQNNFNTQGSYEIFWVHVPNKDKPICICDNVCSKEACSKENIYFGKSNEIKYLISKEDIHEFLVDKDVTFDLSPISLREISIKSLNNNKNKVNIICNKPISLNNLLIQDLSFNFMGEIVITNLTLINTDIHDFRIEVYNLFTDLLSFETYEGVFELSDNYIEITDTQNEIKTIEIKKELIIINNKFKFQRGTRTELLIKSNRDINNGIFINVTDDFTDYTCIKIKMTNPNSSKVTYELHSKYDINNFVDVSFVASHHEFSSINENTGKSKVLLIVISFIIIILLITIIVVILICCCKKRVKPEQSTYDATLI